MIQQYLGNVAPRNRKFQAEERGAGSMPCLYFSKRTLNLITDYMRR